MRAQRAVFLRRTTIFLSISQEFRFIGELAIPLWLKALSLHQCHPQECSFLQQPPRRRAARQRREQSHTAPSAPLQLPQTKPHRSQQPLQHLCPVLPPH